MRERGPPDIEVVVWHGNVEMTMRRTYTHPSAEWLRTAGEALFNRDSGQAF